MHEMSSPDNGTDQEKNVNMIEVTPRAELLLNNFFKDNMKKPIRLFVKLGGCGIRSFGVALEKQRKNDEILNEKGFTFIIEKKIWDQLKPIKIDADKISLRISGAGILPNSGCGTCSFMCGVSGNGRCSGDCLNCDLPCAHGRRIREAAKEKANLDT